jgi:hypothetical protein
MAIIAIDFDRTLCSDKPEPGYRMGIPEPGAVTSCKRLVAQGHTIVIFTARNVNEPSAHKAVADWLEYFGIPHHGITNIKQPYFDVYIDDRALRYEGSWPVIMNKLRKLTNPSETAIQ